jgi:aminoglycoside 6'-N-acetyltransferase
MVELRPMRDADLALLAAWDDDGEVAAALGGRSADWYDWPSELVRDVSWRELLIAEEDGRPIGFIQIADASEEESHYWGDVEPGTWSLDIWIHPAAVRLWRSGRLSDGSRRVLLVERGCAMECVLLSD